MNTSSTKSTTTATATKGKLSSRKARDGKSTPPPLKVKGDEDAKLYLLVCSITSIPTKYGRRFYPPHAAICTIRRERTADIVCSCSQALTVVIDPLIAT